MTYDPLENARLAVELDPASQPPTDRWRLRPLSKATPRQTRWLPGTPPGLIPLRYPMLVASVGGIGKSHWMVAIAAHGSVAEEPWDTIYISFEDGADEVLRPRVEAAGGDARRIHELVLTDADSLASFSLPGDIDDLQTLVRACRARLVVIDPVVAAIETSLDAYKDQHVRQVLAPAVAGCPRRGLCRLDGRSSKPCAVDGRLSADCEQHGVLECVAVSRSDHPRGR